MVVQDFTAVMLGNLLGCEGAVGDVTSHFLVVLAVIGENTKKGRASSTRATEDQDHLTITTEAIHGVDDGASDGLGPSRGTREARLGPEPGVDQVRETNERIGKGTTKLGTDTLALNFEILPDDAEVAVLDSGGLSLRHDVLEIFGQIKVASKAIIGPLLTSGDSVEG